MKTMKCALAAALLSTGMANATCYSVYWADGVLATQTSTAPVDLSLPLGEALAEAFGPDVTMVMSDHGVFCGRQQEVAAGPRSLADAVRAAVEADAMKKALAQRAPVRTAAR